MGMKFTDLLLPAQREILAKARKTYGSSNQILVANEELNELAAVCAKYPRYKDKDKAHRELYAKALDEVADVIIVLDHIIDIFGIKRKDLEGRIYGKVSRLENWMNASDDMEQTTIDRYVPTQTSLFEDCNSCLYDGTPKCTTCVDGSNYCKSLDCKNCENHGDTQQFLPGGKCYECVNNGGINFKPKEE